MLYIPSIQPLLELSHSLASDQLLGGIRQNHLATLPATPGNKKADLFLEFQHARKYLSQMRLKREGGNPRATLSEAPATVVHSMLSKLPDQILCTVIPIISFLKKDRLSGHTYLPMDDVVQPLLGLHNFFVHLP